LVMRSHIYFFPTWIVSRDIGCRGLLLSEFHNL
jgi:hypothetical protein